MRNGGILPWAAWIAAALFFFYGFLLRVSPSVMVGELMRDFAVGAAILGNLSAVYFYLYASLQVPVGLLYDRFGTRRLLTVATLFCAGGAALFAAAPTLEIAYLGRALIGAGAAFSFVGAATIAARDLPARHYATLVGTLQLIGMLGAFGGQGPMALTVDALGWRGAMFAATSLGIALAVAQVNGCNYCLSAHTYMGKNLAKLSEAEIAANRHGGSLDPKADAAVRFATRVAQERGHISDADLQAVRMAGYDDAQIVEIVQHVALNTWTNYINEVAKTEIDFPVAQALAA